MAIFRWQNETIDHLKRKYLQKSLDFDCDLYVSKSSSGRFHNLYNILVELFCLLYPRSRILGLLEIKLGFYFLNRYKKYFTIYLYYKFCIFIGQQIESLILCIDRNVNLMYSGKNSKLRSTNNYVDINGVF